MEVYMPRKADKYNENINDRRDDIESIFKLYSRLNQPLLMPSDNRWMPAVDVFETDDEFVIVIDIAHIDPKDTEVFIRKGYVIIRGVRRELTKYKKRHYHKMEIDFGPFERKINIPVAVDEHNTMTNYTDGFLEIRLKKISDRRGKGRVITVKWED
jgi:HSP20 family protein